MRHIKLGYFIKESIENIIANRLMSVASVGVLVSCLLIMGSFALTVLNINENVKNIEDMNEIVVFIDETYDNIKTAEIGVEISKLNNIKETRFVSKEEGLKILKEKFKDRPEALIGFDVDNPLRDSYAITLKDISKIDETLYQLKQINGIANIRSNKDLANTLLNLRNVISVASFWFIGILFLISVFIISNTIKLTVFARRREINIMKYVGATNWFIRWPFIFEGLILGTISGVVAYIAEWYIYSYIVKDIFGSISNFFTIISFSEFNIKLLLIFIASGVCVGVFGSAVSIRKYLNV